MRVMVIVKATPSSEAGIMPSSELLEAMGNYNEELVKAGIMKAGEGLKPSSAAVRVRFSGTQRIVSDGPFTEGTDCRLLAVAGQVNGGGYRLGQALPESDDRRFRYRYSPAV